MFILYLHNTFSLVIFFFLLPLLTPASRGRAFVDSASSFQLRRNLDLTTAIPFVFREDSIPAITPLKRVRKDRVLPLLELCE